MASDEGKQRDKAQWNERFAGEDYWFGTEPNAFLVSQRDRFEPGQKALAIADGEGRNGVWLAQQGLEVTSVDLSPNGVRKAQQLAARYGVTINTVCADLETWDWGPPRFDIVVAIFIQFAPPRFRDLIFRRMADVLNPGGMILLEGYRPEQVAYGTGGPRDVEQLYTEALLRASFAGMDVLYLAEYDAELHEGSRHHGMSALIDLVVRKPPR